MKVGDACDDEVHPGVARQVDEVLVVRITDRRPTRRPILMPIGGAGDGVHESRHVIERPVRRELRPRQDSGELVDELGRADEPEAPGEPGPYDGGTDARSRLEDSIAWQRNVANSLIQPTDGRLVAEYLDVGVSRSLPWPRRPEDARLLADCARRDRTFDRLIREADLPRITLHGLRHSWATLALLEGIPTKVVSEILGHSSTRVTEDVYQHVSPGMQADATSRVERLLRDSRENIVRHAG